MIQIRCGGTEENHRKSFIRIASGLDYEYKASVLPQLFDKITNTTKIQAHNIKQKRMTVTDRRTSRHATVAWQKINLTRNIRIQESRESPKEFAAAGMRKSPEGSDGIRHRDIKEPPHLRIERKTASSSGGQHKREQ
jgi:hypothetical protein